MSESDLRGRTAMRQDKGDQGGEAAYLKEDLSPLIAELLALKASFKEVTGTDFDPPKVEKEG